MIDREEFIYLIAADDVPGISKIGWTTDLDRRLGALQIGSPVALRLVGYWHGDRELEHWLHSSFAPIRAHGEWFKFRAADRGYGRVDDNISRYKRGDRTLDYQRQPKLSPYMRRHLARLRAEANSDFSLTSADADASLAS